MIECDYFNGEHNPSCSLIGTQCEHNANAELCPHVTPITFEIGEFCPECGEQLTPVNTYKGSRLECKTEGCSVIEVRIAKNGERRVISQPLFGY